MLRIYQVVIETVAGVGDVAEKIEMRDRDLARQMRRAGEIAATGPNG